MVAKIQGQATRNETEHPTYLHELY